MKKVILSGLVCSSIFGMDLFYDSSKVYFNGNADISTNKGYQYTFIYKNGTYIQKVTSGTFETDVTTDTYKAIMVFNDNGKYTYINKEIKAKSSQLSNIAPIINLDYSINNTNLTVDLSKSSDSDGKIVKYVGYLYKNGQYIGIVDTTKTFENLTDGSYKIIASVTDDRGQSTSKTIEFNIDNSSNNSLNYTLGTPSKVDSTKIYDAEYVSNNTKYQQSYNVKINSGAAYSQGWTGKGVKVGIVDSGIDYNHPDLDANIKGVYSVVNYSTAATAGYDDFRHGTEVAGIIAAEKNGTGVQGVAYEADVYNIKALNSSGSAPHTLVADGVRKATSLGVKVTNLSLGGIYGADTTQYVGAYREAVQNDNTIIVAAGNYSSTCTQTSTDSLTGCLYPAVLPLIYSDLLRGSGGWIVVGSADKNGNISSFSNKAGLMKDFFMVAPGGQVATGEIVSVALPGGTYGSSMGTSMATPMVTGAFALLAQKYPFLKGTDIANILFASATDLGTTGVDDVFGHGMLNIEKAMKPIGELTIPTKSGNKVALASTSATGQISQALSTDFMFIDSYNRGFNTKIQSENIDPFKTYNFESMTHFYLGNIKLSLDEESQNAALGYRFNEFYELSFGTENKVFGSKGTGALEFTGRTYYINNTFKYENFGTSLTVGYAKPDVGGMIENSSTIYGMSTDIYYGEKTKTSSWKIGVQTPMQIVKGEMKTSTPTMQAMDGEAIFDSKSVSLINNNDYKAYVSYEIKF